MAPGGAFVIPPGQPLISAHACRVDGGPPHTLAGLERLLAERVEMVEFDVRRTGDGILVAHHDEQLPDGRPVARSSYGEVVAAYQPESRPARIDELVEAAAGSTRLQLDLKEHGIEDEVAELALGAAPPSEIVVTTLLDSQIVRLKAARPELTVGMSLNRRPASFLRGLARAVRCGADVLAIHYLHLLTALPERAAARRLPLFVWTVNDDARLRRVLRDPRIACVITDRPLRARELRAGIRSGS